MSTYIHIASTEYSGYSVQRMLLQAVRESKKGVKTVSKGSKHTRNEFTVNKSKDQLD